MPRASARAACAHAPAIVGAVASDAPRWMHAPQADATAGDLDGISAR
ncbi:MAG: hypothetical protein ABI881_16100 [Betaproteobacteria bacterium]